MQKLIYYVEDDQDDADLFIEAARTLDIQVQLFTTCPDFLSSMESGRVPDIIFLDGSVPGCNRDETVKKLRGNENSAKIPIVIYSGYISPRDQQKLETYENIVFKAKGYKFADIVENIRSSI